MSNYLLILEVKIWQKMGFPLFSMAAILNSELTKSPRDFSVSSLDSSSSKTWVQTPISHLYLSQKLSYRQKRNFANFAGGHFENDTTRVVHPNLVMVASIFHVGRGPRNKIKQVSYVPGGGVHGEPIGPMDYTFHTHLHALECLLFKIYSQAIIIQL